MSRERALDHLQQSGRTRMALKQNIVHTHQSTKPLFEYLNALIIAARAPDCSSLRTPASLLIDCRRYMSNFQRLMCVSWLRCRSAIEARAQRLSDHS
jgi:hypothetical protein